jgi:hypothetical protein
MSQTCVRRAQSAQLQQTLYESAEEARYCLCVLALRPFHMCSASSASAWACAPLRMCPLSDRVCGSSSPIARARQPFRAPHQGPDFFLRKSLRTYLRVLKPDCRPPGPIGIILASLGSWSWVPCCTACIPRPQALFHVIYRPSQRPYPTDKPR